MAKKSKLGLLKSDRSIIRSAARADVEETFASLGQFVRRSRWVGMSNRYCHAAARRVRRDLDANRINIRELSQYIAASCLLHCADGWSYLGKAILCLLRGDPHRCRELAYYGELRAAISLLAGEGIGIFNNRHFVVDAPNSVAALKTQTGTHQFVWDCLEYWGRKRTSRDLLGRVIRPQGRPLEEWLAPVGGARILGPQAKKWFLQWGMDLRMPVRDRDARGESSYRPDGIPSIWEVNLTSALDAVEQFWTALEPSAASRFDQIDRHVFRLAIEHIFIGQYGVEPRRDPARFRQQVSKIVEYQGLSPEVGAEWTRFLMRETFPNDLVLFSLSKRSPELQESSHAAVMARAILLLRVAAGSALELVQKTGLTVDSTAFWWQTVGRSKGLWAGTKSVEGLFDLWADVEPLLTDIRAFRERHSADDQTFFRVGSE